MEQQQERQRQHDEEVREGWQAQRAREWDDLAVQSKLSKSRRSRPLKHFRMQAVVNDADGIKVATSTLEAGGGAQEQPQISFVLTTETVQVEDAEKARPLTLPEGPGVNVA